MPPDPSRPDPNPPVENVLLRGRASPRAPRRQGLLAGAASLGVLSLLALLLIPTLAPHRALAGPVVFLFGLLPLGVVRLSGRPLREASADVTHGLVDGGILAVFAVIGGHFLGAAGAVLGGVLGDAISDGLGGLLEGQVASTLRERGVDESRTPLVSALGKMSGVALGAGGVLAVGWSLLLV